MLTYQDLHQENHKITELTNVLGILFQDRLLCDSDITQDLFFDFVERVQRHLDVVDNKLYSRLLTASDADTRTKVDRFMGGSTEVKRIFGKYLKRWCKVRNHDLVIKDYDRFRQETEEMFDLVLDRLQDETERLYPLVREVTGEQQAVA